MLHYNWVQTNWDKHMVATHMYATRTNFSPALSFVIFAINRAACRIFNMSSQRYVCPNQRSSTKKSHPQNKKLRPQVTCLTVTN